MRGGPSTGMPTRPSQGDLMQARWGTHGDHPVIVLTPAAVQEIYHQTIRAFNLSETYRVPVIVLYDEVVGHLLETVALPDAHTLSTVQRKLATEPRETYQPYATTEDGVPPMARFGDGYRTHMTGLTHAESGFPTQDPAVVDRVVRRLLGKLEHHRQAIQSYQTLHCDDAEVLVVAYGITARAAQRAVKVARQQRIKAGLFRPITMWPFPEAPLQQAAAGARAILVPEMNAGQLRLEVERLRVSQGRVAGLNRVNGEPISPLEILDKISELADHE
jgi:2-oxoglutarate ferredoxin oxidoreductase subunit alpha